MAEVLIPIIAIMGFFSTIIIIAYLYFNSRHRERMSLIEHGKDASIFKETKETQFSNSLKYGVVAVMIGLGIISATLLDEVGFQSESSYFSMVLVFGGAGLMTFYFYMKKQTKNDETV